MLAFQSPSVAAVLGVLRRQSRLEQQLEQASERVRRLEFSSELEVPYEAKDLPSFVRLSNALQRVQGVLQARLARERSQLEELQARCDELGPVLIEMAWALCLQVTGVEKSGFLERAEAPDVHVQSVAVAEEEPGVLTLVISGPCGVATGRKRQRWEQVRFCLPAEVDSASAHAMEVA